MLFKNFKTILFCLISSNILIGCGDTSTNEKNYSSSEQTVPIESEMNDYTTTESDPNESLLGLYHGVQPSYFMKNQYGDDMVINGNKISIPAIDYKFILKQNNIVTLQQISEEDGTRAYYEGKFKVNKNGNLITITCEVSDGKSSSPTYTIEINDGSNEIICKENNQPEFKLFRNNEGQTEEKINNTAINTETKTETNDNVNGVYQYKDQSVILVINVSGEMWSGRTTIITGMGDDYDKTEFESGSVIGSDLYESSGMVKIGKISGRFLTTTIGGSNVTLTKQ